MLKRLFMIGWAALLAVGFSYADQSNAKITIPVARIPAADGRQMYAAYCAPCHGLNGRGQGPVAAALKTPPADLTALSRNNGGKFPDTHIIAVLENGAGISSHGSAEMPVWGPILGKMNQTSPQERLLRISNLSSYLEGLQAK